jgi:hypothetical protein
MQSDVAHTRLAAKAGNKIWLAKKINNENNTGGGREDRR